MPPRLSRRTALLATASLPLATRAGAQSLDAAVGRARALDQLHALVVVHRGDVRLARAFRGPAVDRPVNVKSVSKTIVATLTGIAIDRGAVPGIDARLGDVAPELIPSGANARVADITLEDLVTMQAGLERTSGPNYGAWVESANWIADALGRPLVAEPGTRFLYSTGSFHILGAVLSHATGRSLLELARDWLGAPLDIAIPPWTRDPQGFYLGGNNMALSPLALARFGELWRRGGLVDGRRVLSAAWIEAAWTRRTHSPWSGDMYGYGWFLTRLGGREVAYARGYGGQLVYVVPALELTVAVTSDPTRPARTSGHVGDLHALLAETIMPSVESA